MRKFGGDSEEIMRFLEVAEKFIPKALNSYLGCHIGSIYEIDDPCVIENFRMKIKTHPVLKMKDRSEDPRYSEVLKWYRLFVKTINANENPYPVRGEYGDGAANSPNDSSAMGVLHDDNDYEPDTEGLECQFNLTKKERNPELRRKCIAYYKNEVMGGRIYCLCCGFDFQKVYGSIGEGFIEIHHVLPHSLIEGERLVDPTSEMIPLCSNCHAMIHRVKGRGLCMTLDELRAHLRI